MKSRLLFAFLLFFLFLTGCKRNNFINTLDSPKEQFVDTDLIDTYAFTIQSTDKEFELAQNSSEELVNSNITESEIEDITDTPHKVWVSSTGKKYHLKSDCSNMKSPSIIVLSDAEALGYEPCKRCFKQK